MYKHTSLASKSVLRGNFLYTAHRDRMLHESFSALQINLTSAYNKYKDSPTLAKKEGYQSHRRAFDALLAQMVQNILSLQDLNFIDLETRLVNSSQAYLKVNILLPLLSAWEVQMGYQLLRVVKFLQFCTPFIPSWIARPSPMVRPNRTSGKTLFCCRGPQGQATSLISPITAEEVRSAIKQLKNNKAPGPDSLSGRS